MPARPSEPILAWLRNTIKAQGLNAAALAEASGDKRTTVRRVLAEQEPLTVDQLLHWTQALGLSLMDVAQLLAGSPEPEPEPLPVLSARPRLQAAQVEEPEEPYLIDPYGLQGEQAIRIAFALGVDFMFIADSAQLHGSGIPESTMARFPERMVIRLDAAYHRYNKPQYTETGLTLTLSFDTVRVCEFPWSAIQQVTYHLEPPSPAQPSPPEPSPEEPRGRPALRLVQ